MMHLPELLPIVLVHGGLYDDPVMTAADFWIATGVAGALAKSGVEVIMHERPTEPASWAEESEALAATIEAAGHQRAAVVAGSNGCSAAMRMVLDRPGLAARTMLCWPATSGDHVIDGLASVIIADVHDDAVAAELLAGAPIRGVTPEELAALEHEVVIYPSLPENKIHQRVTVFELLDVIPDAILVGGSPEPLDDTFGDFLDEFVAVLKAFSRVEHDD